MDSEQLKPVEHPTPHSKIITLFVVIFVGLAFMVACIAAIRHNSRDKASNTPPAPSLATAQIRLTLFATGLPSPTDIAATGQKTDTRLFVLDQTGVIRVIEQNGHVMPEPFLNISSKITLDSEMGLLGLAFSPKYAEDGNFFINYIDKDQNTVIARYHVSTDANKADPSSEQVILKLKQPYANHNGGGLAFGPDSYLYIALGDGGSAGDPQDRAQNLSGWFGKILRLDVSSLPYKIPANNPFVSQTGVAPEIWDYGLRNPWRISFDSKTHELYIADVGQGKREEVNVEAAGSKGGNNYGWRCYEGSQEFNLSGCKSKDQYVFPLLEYDHTGDKCSITGGYVYRGQKYPALDGKYFYGDFCSGDLFWAEKTDKGLEPSFIIKTPYKITTFGVDNQEEMYIADSATGSIYLIEDAANPAQ